MLANGQWAVLSEDFSPTNYFPQTLTSDIPKP